MIIILIGYMGSGKSAVGKALAEVLEYEFIDLDQFIEEQEGRSISKIFENQGEIYFRKVESKYLSLVLEKSENIVLAPGGGTPCYGDNLKLLKNHSGIHSFYLKASIKTLANRLLSETAKRPLIAHLTSEEQIVEFIGKHLFERSAFYSQTDRVLETDEKSIQDLVEQIVLALF